MLNNPLNAIDPDGRFVFELISFSWGVGFAMTPIGWATIGLCAVGTVTVWGVQKLYENGTIKTGTGTDRITTGFMSALAGTTFGDPYSIFNFGSAPTYDQYLLNSKSGSVDPSLPANPDDLLKNPEWKETTHPDAGKKGHRTFENEKTGEQYRHDQGRPGQTGHEARDHYHHLRPNGKGGYDYVDGNGKTVPKGSDPAHIYPGR